MVQMEFAKKLMAKPGSRSWVGEACDLGLKLVDTSLAFSADVGHGYLPIIQLIGAWIMLKPTGRPVAKQVANQVSCDHRV